MPKKRKKKTLEEIMAESMPDLSHIKPPTRPAVEIMIDNLHNAGKLQALK